jgi:uncharacterized protein (TIGR00303 family)
VTDLDFADISQSSPALSKFYCLNPFFTCVISHTETSEIPGLTVAGANPELVKYTSPADAEFLHYGSCRCIPVVPATPDGKPTPAVITRAAIKSANLPLLVVEAGTKIKPSIPCIQMGLESGKNITRQDAMSMSDVKKAFEYGNVIGAELAKASDLVVVGESIPGGTTTALAVLTGLGIDARFKVSSSMPQNPHGLKNQVVESAIKRVGSTNMTAFEAISSLGDPMMPTVAGLATGAQTAGSRVMLAGGTQMAAVLAILKNLGNNLEGICIGTTSYVANDTSSDLKGLVESISKVPVFSCDLHLGDSRKPGLQAFAQGFVKEGVGAGGSCIAAMLKTGGKITGKTMQSSIEQEYEMSIERRIT